MLTGRYGGLVHPLTALKHPLPLLALGLLAGQQGTTTARRVLVVPPRAGRGCLALLSATGVAGTSSPEPFYRS